MVERTPATGQTPTIEKRFAITVGFEIKPQFFDHFVALVRANAMASVRDEPQCLRFDVLTPELTEKPHVFLYEIYADRAAFEAHLTSAHYVSFDAQTRSMVANKTVHAYTVQQHAK